MKGYPSSISIGQLGKALRSGECSAVALVQATLDRIDALDPILHSFVQVTRDRALERATFADALLASGKDLGPLHGIPYALKDIIDVAGVHTSCCSRLAPAGLADRDARVEELLHGAGAILVGKTTTHEFALGGPCFDVPFPPARNPFSPEHFSGGSSSGSAVAVAAGMVPLAIGSDTSGSIRGPASYCGIVGLKPTYGLVSRRGVFPLSYSLDHVGPMAWSVADAALALNVLVGFDPQDIASVHRPAVDYLAELDSGLAGLRVGYARAFFAQDCDPSLLAMIDDVTQLIATAGADIEEVDLPDFDLFSACGRLIMTAEGYAIHEEALLSTPEAFGRYTYQRLIPGIGLSAADYIQAQRLRGELTRELNQGALARCNILILGSAMGPAQLLSSFGTDWPPRTTMRTIPFTVTGNPAITVPIGHDPAGLPLAMQIVGRPFDEQRLLGAAHAVEQLCSDRRVHPRLARELPQEDGQ